MTVRNPALSPSDLAMWQDHLPKTAEEPETDIVALDDRHRILEEEVAVSAYQGDKLKIARDRSTFAQLMVQVKKGKRLLHVAKVMHLQEQNTRGSVMVTQFVQDKALHLLANLNASDTAVDKARWVAIKHCQVSR